MDLIQFIIPFTFFIKEAISVKFGKKIQRLTKTQPFTTVNSFFYAQKRTKMKDKQVLFTAVITGMYSHNSIFGKVLRDYFLKRKPDSV